MVETHIIPLTIIYCNYERLNMSWNETGNIKNISVWQRYRKVYDLYQVILRQLSELEQVNCFKHVICDLQIVWHWHSVHTETTHLHHMRGPWSQPLQGRLRTSPGPHDANYLCHGRVEGQHATWRTSSRDPEWWTGGTLWLFQVNTTSLSSSLEANNSVR